MNESNNYVHWSGVKGTFSGYFLNSPVRTIAERFAFGNARKRIMDLLNTHLPEEGTIADFGAGSGYYSIKAASLFPVAKIYAVDLSKEMLAVLHRKALSSGVRERIELVLTSAEDTGLKTGSVDAVITSSFMHEVPDPEKVFAEMYRLVKPGGILIITDFKKSPSGHGHHGDVAHGPLTRDEYHQLYNKHGFTGVTFQDAGSHLFHWGFKR